MDQLENSIYAMCQSRLESSAEAQESITNLCICHVRRRFLASMPATKSKMVYTNWTLFKGKGTHPITKNVRVLLPQHWRQRISTRATFATKFSRKTLHVSMSIWKAAKHTSRRLLPIQFKATTLLSRKSRTQAQKSKRRSTSLTSLHPKKKN